MTSHSLALTAALARIAQGDATPSQAGATIRETLDAPSLGPAPTYDALRDFVWHTLTARAFDASLADWYDVVRYAAGRMRRRNDAHPWSERLEGMAELLGQSARFAQLQPVQEVLKRRHVRTILLVLAAATGGRAPRSLLAQQTGLAAANLSRVLTMLASTGLVRRHAEGKEASFELTPLGRDSASQLEVSDPAAPDLAAQSPDNQRAAVSEHSVESWLGHCWKDAPIAVGLWSKDGKTIATNAAFRQVAGIDGATKDRAQLACWPRLMQRRGDDHPVELSSGPDKRWIRWMYHSVSCGDLIIGHDVTGYEVQIRELNQQLDLLRQSEAGLIREQAERKERRLGYRAAIEETRTALEQTIDRIHDEFLAALGDATAPHEYESTIQHSRNIERLSKTFRIFLSHLEGVSDTIVGIKQAELVSPAAMIAQSTLAATCVGSVDFIDCGNFIPDIFTSAAPLAATMGSVFLAMESTYPFNTRSPAQSNNHPGRVYVKGTVAADGLVICFGAEEESVEKRTKDLLEYGYVPCSNMERLQPERDPFSRNRHYHFASQTALEYGGGLYVDDDETLILYWKAKVAARTLGNWNGSAVPGLIPGKYVNPIKPHRTRGRSLK